MGKQNWRSMAMQLQKSFLGGFILVGVALLGLLVLNAYGRLPPPPTPPKPPPTHPPCPCVQPPSGLTAWWPLDEPNGSPVVNDFAGFNNKGTPLPGGSLGTPAPSAVPGMVNGAVYFPAGVAPSGSTSYISVPNHPDINFGTGDFTIDAWIRLGPPGGIYPIVDKLDFTAPGQNRGYAFFVQNGQLLLRLGPDNSGGLVAAVSKAPSPLTPGNWYHVAVTVRRVNPNPIVTFYVDGNQVGSGPPPGPGMAATNNINSTEPLWIGGNSRLASGGATVILNEITIDELEFFKRELTQQEIQAIYSAGPAGKCK